MPYFKVVGKGRGGLIEFFGEAQDKWTAASVAAAKMGLTTEQVVDTHNVTEVTSEYVERLALWVSGGPHAFVKRYGPSLIAEQQKNK